MFGAFTLLENTGAIPLTRSPRQLYLHCGGRTSRRRHGFQSPHNCASDLTKTPPERAAKSKNNSKEHNNKGGEHANWICVHISLVIDGNETCVVSRCFWFVYMAVDATKKRRSGFLWADAPCLLRSASHGALGWANGHWVNLKPHQGVFQASSKCSSWSGDSVRPVKEGSPAVESSMTLGFLWVNLWLICSVPYWSDERHRVRWHS